jgi:hypothetical protein
MRSEGFPRPFILERHDDVSGVSGTGLVAWGVEFPDGTVALRWNSDWPTSVVFHDKGMEAVRAVHGHDGRTEIVWCDWAPRDEWGGLAWEPVIEGALGKDENPDGCRYILHRLTPFAASGPDCSDDGRET